MLRYDCHDSVSASFGCPACADTLVWSSSSLPARSQDHVTLLGSEVFSPGSPIRQFPRSVVALPRSRVTPLMTCLALRSRWCPGHSPERTQDCCLPATANRRLSPPSRRGISCGPPLYQLRGSSTRPATSLSPAPRLHDWLSPSGSLLTGWLGVGQVGLAPAVLTHRVTITSFMNVHPIPWFRAYLGASSRWLGPLPPIRSGGCAWAGPTSLMPATPGLPGLSRRFREAMRPWHHDVRCLCPRRSWDMLSGYGSGGSLGCDALAWSRGLLAAVLTSLCGVRVPSEYGCHAFVSSR
jgi:hypothetical protein